MKCFPSATHKAGFHAWFTKYKAKDFAECTLRQLREDVGLGSPPRPFYTDTNESANNAIKVKVNFKKSEWPMFNQKMKDFAVGQSIEVERAVVGLGEYRIPAEYQRFQISIDKWRRMSPEKRKQLLKRFHSAEVHTTMSSKSGQQESGVAASLRVQSEPENMGSGLLSVSLHKASGMVAIPAPSLEGMWDKAG